MNKKKKTSLNFIYAIGFLIFFSFVTYLIIYTLILKKDHKEETIRLEKLSAKKELVYRHYGDLKIYVEEYHDDMIKLFTEVIPDSEYFCMSKPDEDPQRCLQAKEDIKKLFPDKNNLLYYSDTLFMTKSTTGMFKKTYVDLTDINGHTIQVKDNIFSNLIYNYDSAVLLGSFLKTNSAVGILSNFRTYDEGNNFIIVPIKNANEKVVGAIVKRIGTGNPKNYTKIEAPTAF